MKTIYLDSDYKCHLTEQNTFMAIETDYFDGKCDSYIEGYRFVPQGKKWVRKDGIVFTGEMISPWVDFDTLETAQQEYEKIIKFIMHEQNIPIEDEKYVQNNYPIDSFLCHLGQLYRVIQVIPRGVQIVLNQNIKETSLKEFLEFLEEK